MLRARALTFFDKLHTLFTAIIIQPERLMKKILVAVLICGFAFVAIAQDKPATKEAPKKEATAPAAKSTKGCCAEGKGCCAMKAGKAECKDQKQSEKTETKEGENK